MRVLSHLGPLPRSWSAVAGVDDLADRSGGARRRGRRRETCCVTLMRGAPNLPAGLERGVRWVHAIGTGVDEFPLRTARGSRTHLQSRRERGERRRMDHGDAARLREAASPQWVTEPPDRWGAVELGGLPARRSRSSGFGTIGPGRRDARPGVRDDACAPCAAAPPRARSPASTSSARSWTLVAMPTTWCSPPRPPRGPAGWPMRRSSPR